VREWAERGTDRWLAATGKRVPAWTGYSGLAHAIWLLRTEFHLLLVCAYCPAPALTVDHVMSVKRGGTDVGRNVLPACGRCNSSKGARPVREWVDSRAELASH
jgi:5-methylcytosine-specific restriction endonuclease McrA